MFTNLPKSQCFSNGKDTARNARNFLMF